MTFCCLFQRTVHFPDAFILVLAEELITQRTDGIRERLLVCGRQADNLRPIVLQSFSARVPKSAAVFMFSRSYPSRRPLAALLGRGFGDIAQHHDARDRALSTTVINLVTVKNFEPPITMIELRTASCHAAPAALLCRG